ncbi:MAG: DNA-directed RNA polymerase subunit omega [Bacillota bacterium]|nr:DNA-directed RNA polymerase subunit omega [Bacillota bacterium]
MMVKPVLSDLMDKVDSKYTLVTISSKRARQIMTKEDLLYENPVSIALQEIADGVFGWERDEEAECTNFDPQINAEGDSDDAL